MFHNKVNVKPMNCVNIRLELDLVVRDLDPDYFIYVEPTSISISTEDSRIIVVHVFNVRESALELIDELRPIIFVLEAQTQNKMCILFHDEKMSHTVYAGLLENSVRFREKVTNVTAMARELTIDFESDIENTRRIENQSNLEVSGRTQWNK